LVSLEQVLSCISPKDALIIFRTIAAENGNSEELKRKTKLTRKQYYSRMSKLVGADLVNKINGRYSLTALGEVVYNSLSLIENGLDVYWKLKTIDALKADKGSIIPKDEHRNLVDTLIENGQIKEILAKRLSL
jgi:predicted transcriptional regulator